MEFWKSLSRKSNNHYEFRNDDWRMSIWIGAQYHSSYNSSTQITNSIDDYKDFEIDIFIANKNENLYSKLYKPNFKDYKLDFLEKYWDSTLDTIFFLPKNLVEKVYKTLEFHFSPRNKGFSKCRACGDVDKYYEHDGLGDGNMTCWSCQTHPDRWFKGIPEGAINEWMKVYKKGIFASNK